MRERAVRRVLVVTNMYPSDARPYEGTFVEQQVKGLRELGQDLHVLIFDRVREGTRVYLRVARETRAAVAGFHPDLVHVMYGGVLGEEVIRAVRDRPAIISFCGDDLLGTALPGVVNRLASRAGVMASHRAARRAAGIVVKSRGLQDALAADVPRSRVTVIPNGVDLDRFRPIDQRACRSTLGWRDDRFHVLFPANAGDPVKRPELARAAVAAVHRTVPAVFHELRRVPHRDVPVWINASDVVIVTSLHEGSPNIVKEALACNVPVVSVDVGDVRERLTGVDGCYVTDASCTALSNALLAVAGGPRRIDGRERVAVLSLARVAERLCAAYDCAGAAWSGAETSLQSVA